MTAVRQLSVYCGMRRFLPDRCFPVLSTRELVMAAFPQTFRACTRRSAYSAPTHIGLTEVELAAVGRSAPACAVREPVVLSHRNDHRDSDQYGSDQAHGHRPMVGSRSRCVDPVSENPS